MDVRTLHPALRDEAVDRLTSGTSVEFVGMPGSGRSLLLQAVSEQLLDRGFRILHVRAIRQLRDRPLEPLAIAGLVGRREATQATTAVAAATTAVVEAVRNQTTVIAVDDVDDLDDTSAGVLIAAHAERGFPLLTTASPQPRAARRPARISAVVQPGVTLTLPALGFVELQTLLAGVLDGPIDSAVISRVFTASGGLPGIALAIVDGARRAGSLRRENGSWHAATDLWTEGVQRALEPLVLPLSPEASEVLHALSLAGVVDLSTARKLSSWEVLDTLDGYGLLRFVPRGEETLVGVYPPVLAERFRQLGISARHLRVNESLALALGGQAAPSAPAAVPGWLGETTDASQPAPVSDTVVNRLLIEHWHRELLVRRNEWEAAPSPRTGSEYLRTLLITNADAATLHAVIDNTPRTGNRRGIVSFDDWSALAVGLAEHDLAGVRVILGRARAESDEWAPLIDTVQTHIELLLDRTPAPESIPLPGPGTRPGIAFAQTTVRAALLVSRGRPGEALELLGTPEWSDEPLARLRLATYGLALLLEARFDEALEWSTSLLEQARRLNDIDAITTHAYTAAVVYQSQLRRSELRALLSSVMSSGVYSALARPAEVGLLSMASALALADGRPTAARNLAEQARALGYGPGWYPLASPTYTLAHLDGADLPPAEARALAADRLWAEYEDLRSRDHLSSALVVGVLALGEQPDPRRARVVQKLAASLPAGLARHFERYAGACASSDPDGAVQAASELAEAGVPFLALAATSTAIHALRTAGDSARAAEVREAIRRQLSRFGPDAAAALDATAAPILTGREFEVARLAADGSSNQAIAQRLNLSVRTVENHLHKVFRKLAVDSRAGLASALGS